MAQILTITARVRVGGQVSPFSAPVTVTVGGVAETVADGAAAGMKTTEGFAGVDRPIDGPTAVDMSGGVAAQSDRPAQGAQAGTATVDSFVPFGGQALTEARTDGAKAGDAVSGSVVSVDAPGHGVRAGDTESDTYTQPTVSEEYVNRVAPATTVAYSGTSFAAVASLQDDPDTASPVTWVVSQNESTDLSVRVGFAPVIGSLVVGGVQEFRARVRKFSGTGTPKARIELWENGSPVPGKASADVDLVAGDPGTVLSFTWNTSEVTNPANVQCQVVVTAQGGTSGDIAAIEWNRRQTIFADEFLGVATDVPDPAVWELYKSAAGETWNMSLSQAGGGKAQLQRPSGGVAGTIAYIRSIPAFSVQAGRYVLANIPTSATTRLFLEGNAGTTIGITTQLGDDGTGLTPGVQIFNGGTVIATPTWTDYGSIGQIKVLIVSATQIRVFADGVESANGIITIPSLGTSLHVGLGARTGSVGISTSQFDRCEVGMQ